jgi:hypothetical protein
MLNIACPRQPLKQLYSSTQQRDAELLVADFDHISPAM